LHILVEKPRRSTTAPVFFASICKPIQQNCIFQTLETHPSGKDGYYVVLGGLTERCHTYRNIVREKCLCINFLPAEHYASMMRAVEYSGDRTDEFAVCGFTCKPCEKIDAPRIGGSFLSLECTLAETARLADGALPLTVGKVILARLSEDYAHGIDRKYSLEGFLFSVHSPIDCETGLCGKSGVATSHIEMLV
jgi:hypothetical protein